MKKVLSYLLCLASLFFSFSVCAQDESKFFLEEGCRIVERPSMTVMGISCRTSNDFDRAPVDIPKLWETFVSENVPAKIPNSSSSEVIALYCDYEGDYREPYTLVIGCLVDQVGQIPDGMVVKEVPATKYAVFHVEGEDFPNTLIETWQKIWNADLKRTYTGDFELFGEGFCMNKELDIYIAIQD